MATDIHGARLLVAEADAARFVASPMLQGAPGAAIVVEQTDESEENLLRRVLHCAHQLRSTHRAIDSVHLLLGEGNHTRHDTRLKLGQVLLRLLPGPLGCLHLVATRHDGDRHQLFELVEQLLGINNASVCVELSAAQNLVRMPSLRDTKSRAHAPHQSLLLPSVA